MHAHSHLLVRRMIMM